ncbi:SCO1-SenC-domain-containing protein [Gonapodya prolifera JEL478]|uniref:SCO1-SenC-domain-containing protein n=1 Tax=Gonapodya prolifera (strain JEL478) TaxID=1344416 RepID=A0A139ALX9_GONPJ|nr:SCO1-SenC-domain-containing protein [Gonapodya prolifera JEL478]|eukprot:KXS17771.1 SCO1-SenC-domain-containing protein [Gonapodya prolifera JEL478]
MTWASVFFFLITGAGLVYYFQYEKERVEKEKARLAVEQASSTAGKPLVGGPFSLVDHEGKPVTDLDYRGRWMLLYFGFTHCPDVCPEELEKMGKIIDSLGETEEPEVGDGIVPIFISCDPKRDSVEVVKAYVEEFHPRLVGLTGTYEQVKATARAYRLYFSAPPRALDDDETDYLVDHSIFFYLVNPDGQYARHYGKIDSKERIVEDIVKQARDFKARKKANK